MNNHMDMQQFFKENFDYSDRETTKFIVEAGDDKVLMALTSKLYEKILEKYEKIDFSSISRSRGDITKIEKYDSLVECIEIIQKLVKQYNEDTRPIDVISSAMENIRSRTANFKKGFTFGSPIVIMTYNTIVTAIVESVSFMIATCVEYIKVPGNETFQMALDTVAYNNTRQNLLFESLATFNEGCATGEFDKAMDNCLNQSKVKREAAEGEVEVKNDSPFLVPEGEEDQPTVVIHDVKEKKEEDKDGDSKLIESLLSDDGVALYEEDMSFWGAVTYVASRGFFFIAKFLIPALRNIVYYFYARRQAKSDYYADMAQLVQMNMYELQQNSTIDVEKKKKILEKQDKIYKNYMRKKNKYSVDYMVGKKSVEKMIKDEDKKMTYKDLDMNTSTAFDNSTSVLF